MRRATVFLAGVVAALAIAAPAQAAPSFEPVAGDYDAPIHLTAPPRDTSRLFVVERGGRVEVVANGVPLSAPFLDLAGVVTLESERGLLSMAFPPDYAASGLAYTYLTGPSGALQVREHRRSASDANRTEPGSRLVWSQAHPAGNHNGGQIHFGPDGLLWIATGDGGGTSNDGPNNAQRLDSQLGKVLRIDPRGSAPGEFTVPADNPFAAPGGAVDTIWASGLRNPFRFSFDRATGDLVLGDVGEGAREEIDLARRQDGLARGADFGWRCWEGFLRTSVTPCEPRGPYLPPVFDYPRAEGRSVTGGVVVRDPGLPSLLGRYVYADHYVAEIRSLNLGVAGADPQDVGLTGPEATHVVAFGEDACGHVYAISIDGPVSRLVEGPSAECVLAPDPNATTAPPSTPAGTLTPGTAPPGAAAPGAAAPGGAPSSGSAAPDTRRPTLGLRITGRRNAASKRRLRLYLRADEPVSATISGRLRGVASFRTARRDLAAGRRTLVNLRLSRRAAGRLRGALRRRGRVIAVVTVQARDAAGNQRRATRRLTIRRR